MKKTKMICIRVTDEVYERLRQRAEENESTIARELRSILKSLYDNDYVAKRKKRLRT
jgi:hypothetical protein